MKVRLIIKQTHQPPIDTPASMGWLTIDIENMELFRLLFGKASDLKYTTSEVVGAQALPPEFPGDKG